MKRRTPQETDKYYKQKLIEYGQDHPGSFRHAWEVIRHENDEMTRQVMHEAHQFYEDII